MKTIQNSRTFRVFTEASAADPAYMCPVVELLEDGRYNMFMNAEVLRGLADQVDEKVTRIKLRMEVEKEILDILGISTDEYIAKCRAKYQEKVK